MKTKFKDLIILKFSVIGICAILMATTNTPQQTTSTVPESHVWESITSPQNDDTFIFNKKTGRYHFIKIEVHCVV